MTEEQTFVAASNAMSFYAAAKRCSLKGMIPLGTPSVICGAFSVELSMKSLLYKNGVESKGHHLLKLMRKLSPEIQNEIRDGLGKKWPDFEEQLENCDKAFVDWRYAHETTQDLNINSNFLILLAEICCKIVMRELDINSNFELQNLT
ncbi:HEPN domain-containing protein [Idiomarina baltica]|uniref:HEPN domain-containing protein n=1 Tax=Idiomarina baltica OS145 TaxID=314276 RepID=A0ABP2CR25_9GAMM|nr:HEPN domain-containing protein [Idiomarina baltica]EAQ32291.1 hypothetical protein OS145_07581 [Idiomarina baltica OS145]